MHCKNMSTTAIGVITHAIIGVILYIAIATHIFSYKTSHLYCVTICTYMKLYNMGAF